jgi:hypothetical protein
MVRQACSDIRATLNAGISKQAGPMRQTPIMAATSPAISVALSDEKARLDVAFRSAALARMLTTIDVHQPPRARVAAWADANTSEEMSWKNCRTAPVDGEFVRSSSYSEVSSRRSCASAQPREIRWAQCHRRPRRQRIQV